MNRILTSTLLIAALAVSACTNPNRFGGDNMNDAGGLTSASGTNLPGRANDPASTPYFSQSNAHRFVFVISQSCCTSAG